MFRGYVIKISEPETVCYSFGDTGTGTVFNFSGSATLYVIVEKYLIFLFTYTSFLAKINGEISHLVDTALRTKTSQLKQVLCEHNIQEDMRTSILSSMQDFHNHVGETFDLFKTPWRIESYLRENFHYIPPTTVKLGNGSFQYVSIKETLKKIQEDKTFQHSRNTGNRAVREEDIDGFLLKDIEDGLLFKENKFFQKNPDALRKENREIFLTYS